MSKIRMFDDGTPEAGGGERAASPRTTIVGGRPPESGDGLPPVPTGIESLLRLASVDEAFRAVLLERRDAAADAAGVALTPNERAILNATPVAQLDAMAARLPPPPPPRRAFLRQAAASAVVALGGAALTACDDCAPTDTPPDRPERNEMELTGGAAPDLPPPRPSHNEMSSEGGIAPHGPPPRPNELLPEAGQVVTEPAPSRPWTPTPPTGISPDLPPPQVNVPAEEPRPRPRPHPTRGIRPDTPGKPRPIKRRK